MRDAQARQADDLLPVRDDPPQVLVSGLPAVFERALAAGLRGRGIRCRTLPVGARAGGAADGPVVLVLLATGGAAALPDTSGLSGPVTVVHVLEDLTVEACVTAVRSGATGVVALDAGPDACGRAVLAAAAGQTLLPHGVVAALVQPDRGTAGRFSQRERAVLRRLGDGQTVAALAAREGVPPSELYRLLLDVYGRLGASDRTQALLQASRAGLLDDEPA